MRLLYILLFVWATICVEGDEIDESKKPEEKVENAAYEVRLEREGWYPIMYRLTIDIEGHTSRVSVDRNGPRNQPPLRWDVEYNKRHHRGFRYSKNIENEINLLLAQDINVAGGFGGTKMSIRRWGGGLEKKTLLGIRIGSLEDGSAEMRSMIKIIELFERVTGISALESFEIKGILPE